MTAVLKPFSDQSISNKKVDFHVVTCFMNSSGRVLVLQRGRKDEQFGLWGIPGGKLDEGETPRESLSREIFEETGIITPQDSFVFLDKALSENSCDGAYVLYLYYLDLPNHPSVLINTNEHLSYKWVTLDKFESLDLLISQGLAYRFVRDQVRKKVEKK
jgi:8-oxo-dGTP diphosphatase